MPSLLAVPQGEAVAAYGKHLKVSMLKLGNENPVLLRQREGHVGWQQALGRNPIDNLNSYGYSAAQTLVQILKQCGDDLTRENVMRQAANLKDLELPMLLPGIKINTSPTDFYPIEQVQLTRFHGKTCVRFGELMSR